MSARFAIAAWCTAAATLSPLPAMTADLSLEQVRQKLEAATDAAPADLAGQDLSDLDLSGLDLSGARLEGTSFFGAKLVNCNLRGSNLRKASRPAATAACS